MLNLRGELDCLRMWVCIVAASTVSAPDLSKYIWSRDGGFVHYYSHQPPLNVLRIPLFFSLNALLVHQTRTDAYELGVAVLDLGSSDASGRTFGGGWLGVNL
ncbi:hypothetical protein BDP55DRAFT_682095 [Colletotrichum godetiae]|uniref:Uncharacterized protein n=1 Tax=Colletotrichum godetiae TaxID=1209918 RepID=A0AAJ0ENH9_9PEZI|nr:uncharacterized protein BDP55DRAFT_682095 [Colletotrichum godetiae]KAK1658591.1 hypothetical protein BDP55DRAFT_682095 [Colletotrichum godetiae]